jgi:DNA-binding NarL/FixJ family response regulator
VITENTVKVHVKNILEKLQLRNKQQLAVYAVEKGLMPETGGTVDKTE